MHMLSHACCCQFMESCNFSWGVCLWFTMTTLISAMDCGPQKSTREFPHILSPALLTSDCFSQIYKLLHLPACQFYSEVTITVMDHGNYLHLDGISQPNSQQPKLVVNDSVKWFPHYHRMHHIVQVNYLNSFRTVS